MGILYQLTFSDGKSYVGVTTASAKQRLNRHRAAARIGRTSEVCAAWRKLGEPRMQVLAVLQNEELAATEVRAIRTLGTLLPRGYNTLEGGDAHPSSSELVRRKLSRSNLGRRHSAEAKANMSRSKLGNQYSKGHKHTEETKARMSASQLGRTHSPETKAKISAKRKGRRVSMTPAIVEANRKRRGVPLPEETKAKMRIAQRARRAAESKAGVQK